MVGATHSMKAGSSRQSPSDLDVEALDGGAGRAQLRKERLDQQHPRVRWAGTAGTWYV
jgi:hypothetical protein